ncbi:MULTISPECIES: plasmid partitioning/stability family protein [Enterobacter cloacae complex]|uniref:plasmid partitioning/stability family protein n=1 Tax=Enterobacter cloacae complex TaxID=354276 RepID=UPI0007503567|nr:MULTISPECIES: plasmid partitioning/stability family protein [Enterobacter cloacae complex]ELG3704678.1 plasmid partitioning/stability family protein [Escherichia coli]KUQ79491.1 plasmid stability protein [Enterobacter hormaechei subsp. steigerwaltii]SAF87499.1 ParB [Enterobacter kobei]HAY2086713.1 plasmid stability protein [Escherichia coli]HAY4545787.1 plasmid stability protein [Escherichia coli]
MDTRRKITFYLNPETNEADRFVCQKTDETPQGDRGRLWRAALLTGFAFGKQDERLPFLFSELLNRDTSFDDLLQLLKAVYPRETEALLQGRAREAVPQSPEQMSNSVTSDEETRNNARSMFGGTGNNV